jgi:protein TonB
MASYSGTVDRRGRATAVAAVVAVHVALAAIILSGLNVRMVSQAVERLKTFDIVEPPPPAPPPNLPPPKPKSEQAKREAGAPAKKAEPTPVVAPPPKIPAPSPIPAAKIAGIGNAPSSGAGTSGTGTGAGGAGYGPGSGGSGGFTPAQKITKIPNGEYRRLVSISGMERGTVGVAIRVTAQGLATNCRVVRSSGSPMADALMCQLTEQYVRFRPARDPNGRAVAQDITWYPNWDHS